MINDTPWLSFKLDDSFIAQYTDINPDLGFDGLGAFVFARTYSRLKEDGSKESFVDVIRRCAEGSYSLQKDHIISNCLGWNEEKAQLSAQVMFDHMYNLRFLPAGRGLWMMGTEYAHTRNPMGLFNCAFVSTEEIEIESIRPFTFLMDVSMVGVGCGFDTKGANKMKMHKVQKDTPRGTFVIPDCREGWIDSLALTMRPYFTGNDATYAFDYSKIRKKGELIKGFGGIAGGHEPLEQMHKDIKEVLDRRSLSENPLLTSRDIVDIMNMIGSCVVAGSVRRTAEIAIGDPDDEVFLNLKNYDINPDRQNYGRFSNNSVFSTVGMNYSKLVPRTLVNGEPGYIWLDNVQAYGRMCDPPDYRDRNARGCNPCGEQSLESWEVCNLVEIFPPNVEDEETFIDVIKYAYLYGKTVTLTKTHIEETNRVQHKNRRIGVGLSGLAIFREQHGIDAMVHWMTRGYGRIKYYDDVYSKWLGIPSSIKTTTIKPSGTVSLVAGVSAGIHYPLSPFYTKNIRMSDNNPLTQWAKDSGFKIEPEITHEQNEEGDWVPTGKSKDTVVISFPVKMPNTKNMRGRGEVSVWEQFKLVDLAQRYWSDNQVSCTVSFLDSEEDDVLRALEMYDRDLKTISFLRFDAGISPQMPEQGISEQEYDTMIKDITLRPLYDYELKDAEGELGCTKDTCSLDN